jgi:hypothetical protein
LKPNCPPLFMPMNGNYLNEEKVTSTNPSRTSSNGSRLSSSFSMLVFLAILLSLRRLENSRSESNADVGNGPHAVLREERNLGTRLWLEDQRSEQRTHNLNLRY